MIIYSHPENKPLISHDILFCIFLILFFSCQTIEDRWEKTKRGNTIEAYRTFLEENPGSKFEDKAKYKIDSLRFEMVKDTNTVKSYQKFIANYPNSNFKRAAQDSIISLKFQQLLSYPETDSLRNFSIQYSWHALSKKADSMMVLLFNEQIQTAKSFSEKDRIENKIIADILKNGYGGRFIIPELLPQNKNSETFVFNTDSQGNIKNANKIHSITIDGIESLVKTLYPKDKLMFTPTTAGLEILYPDSHCGIYRFIGKIKFSDDYTFNGQKTAPLTFMFLKDEGFVYLHGHGAVLKNEREIAHF
ncbi:tetratricopeptide repeat protein [Calditrichota bacterium GD2]